jgi:TIR domain
MAQKSLPAIFINYRQDDTSRETAIVRNALCARWGEDVVFMDKRSIWPSEYFDAETRDALSAAWVVIAMIGPNWLTIEDNETKTLRLNAPGDWVREEIAYALKNRIRVIPVFVRAAKVPTGHELPESIRQLPRSQGIKISDETLDIDIQRLIESIERIIRRRWMFRFDDTWKISKSIISGVRRRSSLGYLVSIFIGVILWLLLHRR